MSDKKRKEDPAYALVYSTSAPLPKRCKGCGRTPEECKCNEAPLSEPLNPTYRLERKGRGGKTVTIIARLPSGERLLKDLTSSLKRSLGCGGTHYTKSGEGLIELQGERIDEVKELIAKFLDPSTRA